MRKALQQLADGEISFDKFARETSADWQRLSQALYHRWRSKLPPSVSVDDLRQEMLLQAWRKLGEYNSSLGPTLHEFIVFQSVARATRYIHSQRNSLRRDGKSPSRFPVAFASLGEVSAEWLDNLIVSDDVDPVEMLDATRGFEAKLESADNYNDFYTLSAVKLSGGNVRAAGMMLFDEPALRLHNRWNSPDAAINHVESHLMQGAVA